MMIIPDNIAEPKLTMNEDKIILHDFCLDIETSENDNIDDFLNDCDADIMFNFNEN